MGGMRRSIYALVCVIMVLSAAACGGVPASAPPAGNPSASPAATVRSTVKPTLPATVEPDYTTGVSMPTYDPEDEFLTEVPPEPVATEIIPDAVEPEDTSSPKPVPGYPLLDEYSIYKKHDMTVDQADNLRVLLGGAYSVRSFTSVYGLKPRDFLQFAFSILRFYPYIVMGDEFDTIPEDSDMNRTIETEIVEKVINSAFGVGYQSGYAGRIDYGITYSDGQYKVNYDGCMHPYTPFLFELRELSSGRSFCRMNIIEYGCDGVYYTGKAKAVVQKDDKSIFGYKMVSCQSYSGTLPKFTKVTASSYLPAEGEWTHLPANVVDDDSSTTWEAEGDDLWIKLSADTAQTVTGMIVSADSDDWQNLRVAVELSDGTRYSCRQGSSVITFGKAVRTRSIKVLIYGVDSVSMDTLLPF